MIDNKAIFNISYGLFVLVARQGDKDNACIINVAQQVTSDPLQLMICVNKQNLTHDMILRTLKFNLCPLCEVSAEPTTLHKDEDPMKPFQHFGFQSGKTVDKFAECETELRTENGLRYLPKFINSVISCVVTKSIDLGTHTMFIAMPMEARVLSDSPSITYAYYQQHIKPKPAAAPAAGGKKKWVCEVCGYVYEGDELPADFICPWCKHPASDFKLME
jgi:flavin reductase (DIM6/NTAB) family NADH-FMN oxidoreductase RutF